MVRSGSGGIKFNGHIVEFGQSHLSNTQLVYPLEITEPTGDLEDRDTAVRRRRNTNTPPSGYGYRRPGVLRREV
jgi:hypothetical protein